MDDVPEPAAGLGLVVGPHSISIQRLPLWGRRQPVATSSIYVSGLGQAGCIWQTINSIETDDEGGRLVGRKEGDCKGRHRIRGAQDGGLAPQAPEAAAEGTGADDGGLQDLVPESPGASLETHPEGVAEERAED